MKKIAVSTIMAAAMFVSAPAVQAASQNSTFNVIINLTSACTISTPANITLNYTAGGATVSGSTSANVNCTNNLPYSLSLNGLVGAGSYGPLSDAATGLNYSVAFNAAGTAGADVLAQTGTGLPVAITIGANIPAAQMGTCATATCNNGAGAVQTVYVNY